MSRSKSRHNDLSNKVVHFRRGVRWLLARRGGDFIRDRTSFIHNKSENKTNSFGDLITGSKIDPDSRVPQIFYLIVNQEAYAFS